MSILHGGRLDSAISRHGGTLRDWLDLSTCLNPDPYRVRGVPPMSWTRLPDESQQSECRSVASRLFGVSQKTHISLASGVQSHIQQLPYLFKPSSVSIVGFTYGEHSHCWSRAGHKIFVSDGLESALQNGKIVIVVNPNNPDGKLYSPSDLLALSDTLKRRSGTLIVDESFIDLCPDYSVASHTGESNLIVLRSFSKFYGLGGLRLGFALCDKSRGKELDDALGPWSVSGPSLFLGTKALSDRRWHIRARNRLSKLRTSLASLLESHGFTILGSTDLFILTEHPQSSSIMDHLLSHHILVRDFPERPQWLRFAIPKKSSLSRLSRVLSSFGK